MLVTDSESLRQMLKSARVIAVVGYSDNPHRPSNEIGRMLKQVGYTVYPVNPNFDQVDGMRCYPTLADVPEPIDIVDVFRRAEFLADLVDEAAAIKAKAVWGQFGVESDEAAIRAENAGIALVMDRCIKVEFYRLNIKLGMT